MGKPKTKTTIADLTPDPRNANRGTERGSAMLEASLRQFGAGRSLLVDKHGVVIAGNKTLEAAASVGLDDVVVVQTDGTQLVVVQRTDLDLDADPRAKALGVADNRVAQIGLEWDAAVLAELVADGADLSGMFSDKELAEIVEAQFGPEDDENDADAVPEPPANAITQPGDLWLLGDHRLLCGDSTSADNVARLLRGKQVALIMADPPYFRKVDAEWDNQFDNYEAFLDFLRLVVATWAPMMLDRGTAGWWCAPDFAWHIEAILRDHFAVFNHIVWSKGTDLGGKIPIDEMRRWRPRSERLLLCEKQHSPDALLASFNAKTSHIAARSAYASIIDRLIGWQKAADLTNREIDKCLGTNGMAGHYFGRSQWTLPTREAWQKMRPLFARQGVDIGDWETQRSEFDAQRSEFDAQRREFDAQRDAEQEFNATDVWQMSAPRGEDRFGHPTPKPVALIGKLVSAHSRPGDLVVDPFLGSGTTLIASERLGRTCYGMELSPQYCDVIVQRWEQFTGQKAERITDAGHQ